MGTKCAGVKRLWRPFLGVVVAYAVAIQSLLLVLGGFAPAAQIDSAVTGLELCHQHPNARVKFPEKPRPGGSVPSFFCLPGPPRGVTTPAPAVFHRVNVAI